ncbi:MAG: hypothetical protein RMI45_00975 [Ignisphaera sp.]|nr:hypothetical protein [Ignisphaera sp.]MDW8084799.1 hypothetical protein [Ignisphaera sp.]
MSVFIESTVRRVEMLTEKMLNLLYHHLFEVHLLKPEGAVRLLRRAGEDVIGIAQGVRLIGCAPSSCILNSFIEQAANSTLL